MSAFKVKKEAPFVVGEVNFSCEADLYHPEHNPAGHIHYGTAMNRAVMEVIVPYLPSFLTTKDTVYQLPSGNLRFREYFARQTSGLFSADHTVTCNTIYSVLTILALHQKTIGVTGIQPDALSFVASHSKTGVWKSVDQLQRDVQGVKLHVIALAQSLEEQQDTPDGIALTDAIAHLHWLQSKEKVEHVTVVILQSVSQLQAFSDLLPTLSVPVIFAVAAEVKEGIRCGLALTKDPHFLKVLKADAFFYPLSSAMQAAVLGNHEVQHGSFDTLAQTIATVIDKAEGIASIPPENIVFGTGGSAILEALGKILFNAGDRIGLDAPFYPGFVGDFTRSGLELHPVEYHDEDEVVVFNAQGEKSIAPNKKDSFRRVANTLQLRAKRAYEDGCQGYIVCNPHNPSGRVCSGEEIEALVKWVVELNAANGNPSEGGFHVIFDELYSQSVFDLNHRRFTSAIPHALTSPYVHVVRGFAKDFGLCGFKTGYGFSSNAKVLSLIRTWQKIMRPSAVNAWILQEMLLKTNYGEDIYRHNRTLLSSGIARMTKLLDEAKISYLLPRAGVFIMVNLSPELRNNPEENEYTLWKKLLLNKRVNMSPGKLFGYREPGWYRLSSFTPVEIIDEGFGRVAAFVEEEFR